MLMLGKMMTLLKASVIPYKYSLNQKLNWCKIAKVVNESILSKNHGSGTKNFSILGPWRTPRSPYQPLYEENEKSFNFLNSALFDLKF